MKPEEFIGEKAQYDNSATKIWAVSKNGGMQMLLDLRGWGAIQNLFPMTKEGQQQAADFQDELGEWIVDAINQKLKQKA